MLLSLVQRLFAILSLVILAVGAVMVWSWWRLYQQIDPPPGVEVDTQVWRLWIGLGLIAVSFLGRTPTLWLLGGSTARAPGGERPRDATETQTLDTPAGARLCVQRSGPTDAPMIVLVHGWGMDQGFWRESRAALEQQFEVVTFDLAGLGRSRPPRDRFIRIERFADDLSAVVRTAGRRKVVLVGHSIGGMTVLTFCRRYPEMLNRQVAGVVLANTTADNPARTTILGETLYAARPLLRPLMWLDVWLNPLVWAMNWQSYLSGSTHLAMRLGGFGERPSRERLDRVALATTRNSPAVQARGNLAMMDWRIEDELPKTHVPALVFIGGRDLVTVPAAGEAIAWRLPQARPCRIGDAGHMGPLEHPDDYDAAIAAFAAEVSTAGAVPVDVQPGQGRSVFGDPAEDAGAEARLDGAPGGPSDGHLGEDR